MPSGSAAAAAALWALAACCGVVQSIRDEAWHVSGRGAEAGGCRAGGPEDGEDPVEARTEHAKLVRSLPEDEGEEEVAMDFVDRGCFVPSHGSGGGDGDGSEPQLRDPACISWAGAGACHSGLAFFRKRVDSSSPREECLEFCLSKGLDLFGLALVEPGSHEECRCGASALNSELLDGKQPRPALGLPAVAQQPPADADRPQQQQRQQQHPTEACRVRIWQFSPPYVRHHGRTPLSLFRRSFDDEVYIDSVVLGRDRSKEEFEDGPGESPEASIATTDRRSKPPEQNASMLQTGPHHDDLVLRDCATHQCAAGKAWGPKVYLAFTSRVTSTTKRALLRAAGQISYQVPCIAFYELRDDRAFSRSDFTASRYTTASPLAGTILVDSAGEDSGCYTSGAGWPDEYGMRYVNLGWCRTSGHEGTMIHELLHALGLAHEHQRPDSFRQFAGKGPHNKLLISEDHKDYDQYEEDEGAYMGSVGLGGYTPFDYESIMMYPAGDRHHMVTRPYDGIRRHFVGRYDHLTGNRNSLSGGDVLQLRDMYGCLLSQERDHACPTFAATRKIDSEGDCSCPGGSVCYKGDRKGCPQHSSAISKNYFSATCLDCVCRMPTCPRSALHQQPESTGYCRCGRHEVCMRNSRLGCPSPRSHHDPKAFWSTCKDCDCRADTCPRTAGAADEIPDYEGDCQCARDKECWEGDSRGCRKRDGDSSDTYFDASCRDCQCRPRSAAPWIASEACLGDVASQQPDFEGDCKCKDDYQCWNGQNDRCPSSAGSSSRYFSLACKSCRCLPARGSSNMGLDLYQPHDRCNTKCGAKMAGRWSLDGFDLIGNECGRCFEFEQESKNVSKCTHGWIRGGIERVSAMREKCNGAQSEEEAAEITRKNYRLVDSGSSVDFCCQRYQCPMKEGCFGGCGPNAKCVHRGNVEAVCVCEGGFEQDPNVPPVDGLACVPKVPPGSRCCYDPHNKFMWVAKHALDKQFWGLGFKAICPTINGIKWHHSKDDSACEAKRVIFDPSS